LALPLFDLLLVALKRPAFRLLATEAQIMQEPCDMTAMEPHATVLLDELSYAPARPQLGAKAIGHRPFEQQFHDLFALRLRQAGRSTRGETNLQGLIAAHAPRQRITELAAQPTRRPTSLREYPSFIKRSA
jgi:hypothetical protein